MVTLGAQGAQDTASTHDMIISIQGKVAKEIWTSNQSKTLPRDFWIRAKALLTITHATTTLDDLRIQDEPSSIRLHKLRGDRRHYWSVTIKLPWCITFKFKNGEFSEVMIENYHRG
ncbi:MAG TPA: type II toxin-antitoxin system RelE/ParE family toxin [Sulfuricaulis sp.]|nr:type II toxin-antitoxin system RelE/ParE family toxin [Sulfuricaulis sp.]